MKKFASKYDISVIIPTYNRSLLLSYSLDSLVNQDINIDRFEVIIADDGSNDPTCEVVAHYSKLLNIKYIYQDDLGFRPASARNKAIKESEGHICLFIDSGIILHSTCISTHIKFHAAGNYLHSAVGYVYGYDHDEESETTLSGLIDSQNADRSIRKLSKYERFHDIRENLYKRYNYSIEDLPASWFYFWTCHVSVVTSELFKVGLFDERYDGKWGVEDLDLGFRLSQHGRKIFLLKAAKAIHFPHGKDKSERHLEGYENLKYFHEKYNTIGTQIFVDRYFFKSPAGGFFDLNDKIFKAIG